MNSQFIKKPNKEIVKWRKNQQKVKKQKQSILDKFNKHYHKYWDMVFKNVEISSSIIIGYQHFVTPFQISNICGYHPAGMADMLNKAKEEQMAMIVKSVLWNSAKMKFDETFYPGRQGLILEGFKHKFKRLPYLSGKDHIKLIFNKGYYFKVIPYALGGNNCMAIESYVKWEFK